jgi:hypothetical protein
LLIQSLEIECDVVVVNSENVESVDGEHASHAGESAPRLVLWRVDRLGNSGDGGATTSRREDRQDSLNALIIRHGSGETLALGREELGTEEVRNPCRLGRRDVE